MNPIEEFETALDAALNFAEDKAAEGIRGYFSAIVTTISKKLEAHDVRVVLAAVGESMGGHPQVEVTADMNDVTASVVAQVIDPVLRKAGVPDQMVTGFAGAAGTATVKFLERYRQYRVQRAAAAATAPSEAAKRSHFKPKWDPSKPRAGHGRR